MFKCLNQNNNFLVIFLDFLKNSSETYEIIKKISDKKKKEIDILSLVYKIIHYLCTP